EDGPKLGDRVPAKRAVEAAMPHPFGKVYK
ncbi:MAG: hypothetical protein ACI9TI_002468, partial [Natronomonas sp.]